MIPRPRRKRQVCRDYECSLLSGHFKRILTRTRAGPTVGHSLSHPLSVKGATGGARLLRVRLLFPVLLGVVVVLTACQGEGIEASPTTSTSKTVPKFVARKYGGPENYVLNPSFEDRLKQWGPWTYNSVVRRTRRYHQDGKIAAEVAAREAAPYGIVQASLVGYPGRGEKFVLSAWVRTIGRAAVVHFAATESGGKAEPSNFIESAVNVGTRWKRISARGAVAKTDRTALSLYLGVTNSIAPGDRILVDGVTLYSVPEFSERPRARGSRRQ